MQTCSVFACARKMLEKQSLEKLKLAKAKEKNHKFSSLCIRLRILEIRVSEKSDITIQPETEYRSWHERSEIRYRIAAHEPYEIQETSRNTTALFHRLDSLNLILANFQAIFFYGNLNICLEAKMKELSYFTAWGTKLLIFISVSDLARIICLQGFQNLAEHKYRKYLFDWVTRK